MSPAVIRVVNALSKHGLRKAGEDRWVSRCPAHDDRTPSLSITGAPDGRALLHCHAGCDTADVVEALRLTLGDLMPPRDERRPHSNGTPRGANGGRTDNGGPNRIAATYDYCDERGELLYQVVRFEPKDFRQRRPTGGGWTWSLGDVPRVLYRLPELLTEKRDAMVFVVEGEKDAGALARLGLPATTNAGGAGKWRAEYGEALTGRHVVILPDNDEPGRKHAEQVAGTLKGIAASVKVVELPGLPAKGDVSDWLAHGGTVAALLALTESAPIHGQRRPGADDGDETPAIDLAALAATEGAPAEDVPLPEDPGEPEHPADQAQKVAGPSGHGGMGHVVSFPSEHWPEPEALPDDLPSVPLFDERLLPAALRPWLSDVAERTQCPPEYAAVGAMVALSAVVGRSCAIRPKRQDDWTVVPNLWGAVVGPPSAMKSPALTEALRPVRRLAVEAAEEQRRRLDGYPAALAEAKARRGFVETKMKAAARTTGDMAALRAEFESVADPPEPTERRYIVNDATVEKLGELLNENSRGLLHFRDELTGWLATLDRDGHENDRAFFLEAWNGTGRYTYDRISRGTLHIEAACVSMLGGIQPGPLAQYLRGAVRGGAGDDGLMQRFQLLVYPDPPKTWKNVDRWPDNEARSRASEVFRRLDGLSPEALGAQTDSDGPPFLRFDDAAQELFNRWRADLMTRLRDGGEHAAIEAHLAKFPSLLPSIALLCDLADVPSTPPGPVTAESVQRAAAWCDLLEAHARRVYAVVTAEKSRGARALLAKLRAGRLSPRFSAREVYNAGWAGLTDREVVNEVLAVLEDHGWVRQATIKTGGRPRVEYTSHPSLGAKAAA